MKDMLVRLLELPDVTRLEEQLFENEGILFRRPIAPEKTILAEWAGKHFSDYWKNEVETAFTRLPVTCFVAQRENTILGFSCYECTAKSFFGPTGTLVNERGKGIGKVLLVKSLQGLRDLGYIYGIIGGVGPEAYYKKTVGAISIPGSENSVYKNMLKSE
ncbi:hypothetical protein [Ascidiimonas aurantiaca]|uniref:GNAT family N-acetyltransferase n=1 Tax=Ascidiimonas aurantiaca TaxID=1685432 RepID=UPI0030EB98DA